jgi:hypothetical protein
LSGDATFLQRPLVGWKSSGVKLVPFGEGNGQSQSNDTSAALRCRVRDGVRKKHIGSAK